MVLKIVRLKNTKKKCVLENFSVKKISNKILVLKNNPTKF